MDKMLFSDWLTKKYIEWRGDSVGRQGTISEFAAQIGVGQSLVSQWMKPDGKKPTSSKAINGLYKLYGVEVYDVLGMPRPTDAQIEPLAEFILSLPVEHQEAARKRAMAAIKEFTKELGK